MYCYEASNVMYHLLTAEGVAPHVDFRYLPVNHVAADGSYQCFAQDGNDTADLDCNATRFDSCLVRERCWPLAERGCDSAEQLRIASFLACFEGPHANVEGVVAPSRRGPCLREAGIDPAPVAACAADAARAGAAQAALNASKATMMAGISPNPGYFPHIFVDGEHQGNFSWVHLLQTVCSRLPSPAPAACRPEPLCVTIDLAGSGLAPADVTGGGACAAPFGRALSAALSVAASNATLPAGFAAQDPAGYVDVHALLGDPRPPASASSSGERLSVHLPVTALAGLARGVASGAGGAGFPAGFAAALRRAVLLSGAEPRCAAPATRVAATAARGECR